MRSTSSAPAVERRESESRLRVLQEKVCAEKRYAEPKAERACDREISNIE